MTTHPLTPEIIKGAQDMLKEYSRELFAGGEPAYPQEAADIVARARREGFIETPAEARTE
jgi:hypothetical protein